MRAVAVAIALATGVALGAATLPGGAPAATKRALHGSVTVVKVGSGSGVVIGRAPVPDGVETQLNCGSQCRATVTDVTDPLYQSFSMTATPDPGSTFEGWSGACSGSSRSCTIGGIQRLANYTATARFERKLAPEYPIAVAIEGQGSVASTPEGIACGSTCSAIFKTLSTVTLTATPAKDWTFGGWSAECAAAGTGPCALTVDGPKTITARFDPPTYPLSVAVAGEGDVASEPAGLACGATCVGRFQTGSTVRLVATPRAGATFTGWSGACAGSAATCDVVMSAAGAVTATFSGAPGRPLAVVASGADGEVVSTPAGIACGAVCGAVFPDGRRVVLTATPAEGAQFVRWDGSCVGSTRTCTLTMSAARAAVALFAVAGKTQVLAVTTSGKGSVRSAPAGIACPTTCAAAFDTGAQLTLTAKPAAKQVFVGWTGACTGRKPTCALTMDGPRTTSAQFAPAADQKAPKARALPSSGPAGTGVRLRYRVSDDSGRTREQAVVYAGAKAIATLRGPLHATEADALFYFLPWRPGLSLAGKTFRFCVWAYDAAGNAAPRTCSRVKVT